MNNQGITGIKHAAVPSHTVIYFDSVPNTECVLIHNWGVFLTLLDCDSREPSGNQRRDDAYQKVPRQFKPA